MSKLINFEDKEIKKEILKYLIFLVDHTVPTTLDDKIAREFLQNELNFLEQ